MSWFNLWDGLKTKTCRYLLQRYLGQFFENNLNLEQLKVDLYNGKAVVENISLKVNALNEFFEEQGWAFEVISGHIGCLEAMVPWNALMTNDSSLNISDLTITLRPVTRCRSGTTMLESMWSSVSSSMQMAEECMKQVDDDVPFLNPSNTLIGLEKFAETIDNVLNRIHANLTNTTLNIEYTLPKSSKKLIISLKASHVEYKNQTGYEKYTTMSKDTEEDNMGDMGDQPSLLTTLPMIAKHQIITNELIISTSEVMSLDSHTLDCEESFGRPCKIVEFKGCQNFKISIKQTENIVGPKVNLEIIIDDIYFMLTPRQTHLLARILKGFSDEQPKDNLIKHYKGFKNEISNVQNTTKMTGILGKDSEWVTEEETLPKQKYLFNDLRKNRKPESVVSSTITNSMATSYSNTQIYNMGCEEKSGEILKFKAQIFKIVGVLLHNDILLENRLYTEASEDIYADDSFENYSKIANNFFPSTRINQHLDNCFVPITNQNYLLIMVSSLLVNGNQQRICQELTLKNTLSATMVDFCEILDNVETPLISFDRQKNCVDGYHTRPEVLISHTSSSSFKPNCNRSSNQMECMLDDCTVELDITIYDRLNALLGASPFEEDGDNNEITVETSNPMEFQTKCNSLKLQLRFPIVDGRAPQDPMKIPFWKQNIRNDYLSFDFQNVLIGWKSHISISVDELDGYYCDVAKCIHVLNCRSRNDSTKDKICISVHSFNGSNNSLQSSIKQQRKSPFSSKCSYGYSTNIEGLNDGTDRREIFLPGDTEEINEFCDSSKNSSGMFIYINIPIVKIVLESKELYEVIYNRLNSDLLMWEPTAAPAYPELKPIRTPSNFENSDALYQTCFESQQLDGNTSYSESSSPPFSNVRRIEPNNMFSFELYIDEGKLSLCTEFREESENLDQQNLHGRLQLNIKGLRLFSVSGYNNDNNLNYICLQLNEAVLLHCGQILEDHNPWSDNIDKSLERVIYKCTNNPSVFKDRVEMISLVAELRKQPENRIKRIKLAFGINGAILMHRPQLAVHNWIYQLIEFFNITEYPIEAYEPFALVSEIQGHLWNFGIQYRPKYLPYRAFVDIGYFSVSSNIIYPMTGCTLRLMTEDLILSIGPAVKYRDDENDHCDGVVPVLNAGLLNISIRLNDETKTYPSIDLRSAIHDVHLKTCYDSTDALAQLISYIANDKDLASLEKKIEQNKSEQSCSTKSETNNDDSLKHINKLMADAVKDVQESKKVSNDTINSQSVSCSCDSNMDPCNILDFESNLILNTCCPDDSELSMPIQAELGMASYSKSASSSFDEKEFHVIHDEELFFVDNFGVDQIYVSEDPLRIVDNHFCLPSEKTDLLRPPEHFPMPESSYTLCEMTFTWHLYGGKDFPNNPTPQAKDKISFSAGTGMSETYKHGVSQAASHEGRAKNKKIIPESSKTSQRNQDVLVEMQFSKIRISHDTYPIDSIYASRQVLIISEIEIRDRLVSSEINKMLYHPFKANIPQKSNENMITVKALNVRSNSQKHRAEECSLKVSVLPIRLNIDQDTLLFLEEFFTALIEKSKSGDSTANDAEVNESKPIDVPVMEYKEIDDLNTLDAPKEDLSKLNEFGDDTSSNDPIYFKEFTFSPALPICFDYHGRRIELSRGPITGLLMGLAQLQGSGICLREVINRRGLLGWNKLFDFLGKEWLKDIKRNQLPNILSGIGPTNAVLQLFQGFFDLFRLPLQQYNKDGRIIRGFQLGAQSFSARTAFAALEITSRIIHLLQFTAETTFEMLSPGQSSNRRRKAKLGKKRQGRPSDLREGVANAYTIVKEGINETANTLMEAAVVEHDQKGYSGAVGAVVRQIPQLVVCPAVLATQATTNILGGAKSSLVPEAKHEVRNKWKQGKN